MESNPITPVFNISPLKRRKRRRISTADLNLGVCYPSLFHNFELKADDSSAGHHYTKFSDGWEIYVNDDGIGIYVDTMGFRSLYVRPKKDQEAMRQTIGHEMRNASDLERLRYKVRGFFAERAVKELGIKNLRRGVAQRSMN
ncbi:hypothetical protein BHYA_0055g00220 [Botrytis hyacinthi]|uniref:Uncharacterized protein n=1 Tax=Botrytis hyacinthi TaxID=278943 RepID=A0A4Z1GVY3_9HELO|nr:hypothetical protein BHYA_0055g00220 [Botrytis hyacinthi]